MKRAQLLGIWLIGAILLTVSSIPATAQKKSNDSDSKVKAKAAATKPDPAGKQTVVISLEIDKGWHLYANPTGFERLEPCRTKVTIKAKGKVVADVHYPTGTEKIDSDDPTVKYRVYTDRVAIPVQVQRTVGDTSPLEIRIDVCACTDKTCLRPAPVHVTVP